MAKVSPLYSITILCLLTIFMLIILKYISYYKFDRPKIASAHIINLDSSKERWAEIAEYANEAKLPVQRWPAVRGKDIKEEDLVPMKLSKYIFKYGVMTNQHGIIGCFLSHRTLLDHLKTLPSSPNDCHLVLEDDAFIPPDFLQQWENILDDVPNDWDMIMLGIQFPNLRQLKGRVHTHLANKGNVGTHAYMVRHKALPKITKHLEYMYDAIDLMLRNKWKDWKIYILWPQLCYVNDHGESTIVVKETKPKGLSFLQLSQNTIIS